MDGLKSYNKNIFESIKHINAYDQEFWYARELQTVLEYAEWRNFNIIIDKAKEACKASGLPINDYFVDVNKIAKSVNYQLTTTIQSAITHYICGCPLFMLYLS